MTNNAKQFRTTLLLRKRVSGPGTGFMILKIFSLKNFAKKLAFFAQNKANYAKIGS
jgi:hypothetical protein